MSPMKEIKTAATPLGIAAVTIITLNFYELAAMTTFKEEVIV